MHVERGNGGADLIITGRLILQLEDIQEVLEYLRATVSTGSKSILYYPSIEDSAHGRLAFGPYKGRAR